jgi:PAS domain S-box-containing protein
MYIAAIYAAVGVLWIIFSDSIVNYFTKGSEELLIIAQVKGVGFVLVTATILFFLIKRHYSIIEERQSDLDLLFNQGNLGLIKLTRDGTIEFISSGLAKGLGYTTDELIGTSVQDITHPDDISLDMEMVEKLEQQEISNYVFEKRYLKKGSEDYIWVTLNGTVQRKNGVIERYVTAIQDLSPIHKERSKAESEIREKRALINSTHDIIWSVNNKGELVSFNDPFQQLIGSLTGKTVNRGDQGMIKRDDTSDSFKRWMGYYKQAGISGRYSMVEHVVINDATRSFEITFHPIVEEKQVLGVSCFGRDITDLVNTEKNLRQTLHQLEESTRFIQLALNRLPIGVAMNEIDSGKVTFWNDKFTEIYGLGEKDIVTIDDFFAAVFPDPVRRKEWKEKILGDVKSGLPERMIWSGVEIKNKPEQTYVNAMNIPLPEQNLMISTVIDVTSDYQHLKTIEDQNERLKKIAWHQSHMVRSKLTNIISLISLIREDVSQEQGPSELLERLDQAANEFDQSVREVAHLSKRLTEE